MAAEDLAPALARQTPAWATELLQLAKTSFVKNDPKNWEECKVDGDFTKEVPLWVLDFEAMPIPSVFPLLTAVKHAKDQWFGDRSDQSFSFPPPGMVLEVAKYRKQLTDSDCGKLQRANLDIVFFAWLLKFKEVSEAKESKYVAMFRKAALRVLMTVRYVENEATKLARAYQLREDEEKNATIAGHSLLSREHLLKNASSGAATNLVDYMAQHKIVYGTSDSTLSVGTIRLHLRVLRRLSLAMVDSGTPAYEGSALYWFDRNEELWGRKGIQVTLQENARNFDAFQAALPNLDDLRDASMNLHILLLRGNNIKLSGRGIGDLARALVLYSRVPTALLPRFEKYAELLKPFASLREFHREFPVGMEENGSPAVRDITYPMFAQESADKLTTQVLIPLFNYKKHGALMGGGSALGVVFVKQLLPELEAMYAQEQARQSMAQGISSVSAVPPADSQSEEPVSEEEAAALKKAFDEKQMELLNSMAQEFLNSNVLLLSWTNPSLMDALCGHPLTKDGASKLFCWQAGLDATTGPTGRTSIFRMKAAADETRMDSSIDMMAKLMRDLDSGLFFSGRNTLIAKDLKKKLQALKPKVGLKEMQISPDEEVLLRLLHGEGRNQYASLDPVLRLQGKAEIYFHIVKTSKCWKDRRPAARRFVSGNTAFRTMQNAPILETAAMHKVSSKERDAVFRNVIGSDRWSPGVGRKSAGGGAASATTADRESESEEGGEENPLAGCTDAEGNVVLFHMELHPKVLAQLLWENQARVLIDFSPGSAMMARTALSMGVKVILIGLNDAHVGVLRKMLTQFIRANIDADMAGFAPSDKMEKLQQLKPARLKLHESRRGIAEMSPPLPGAGKATFEKTMSAAIDALQTGANLPPAKRQRTEPKPAPPKPSTPAVPKPKPPADPKAKAPAAKVQPAPTPATGAAPSESVADLLNMFS
ncbi:unnamed protein product [Symbiodinium sp. CCMP2592]|nr:unnamed protein product [Symbiodinium sp. CCMP2592]CAE7768589.1 unnamed protein product [Symbiodinium sp. CCMP2592]